MEDTQNNPYISSSDETSPLTAAPIHHNSQKETNSNAKRIKRNDPIQWSPSWGPPV